MGSDRHQRRRRDRRAGDDAFDPDTYFAAQPDARGERKVQQLCKEVARTLGYALGSCGDPRLCELIVFDVIPAPDGARLEVLLFPSGTAVVDGAALEERLSAVRGFLRREVAAALQRKRTPELVYRITPPPGVSDPEGS
jgi:ribosome-binding factor A